MLVMSYMYLIKFPYYLEVPVGVPNSQFLLYNVKLKYPENLFYTSVINSQDIPR